MLLRSVNFGAVLLLVAIVAPFGGLQAAFVHTNLDLVNLMMKSSDAIQRNPQLSMECFGGYSSQVSALTEEYQREYDICMDTAQQQNETLIELMDAHRTEMLGNKTEACASFDICEQDSNPEFFDCYALQSRNVNKIFLTIEASAREDSQNFRKTQATTIFNQNLCTDAAYATYASKLSILNDRLDVCLNDSVPVPTQGPGTGTGPTQPGQTTTGSEGTSPGQTPTTTRLPIVTTTYQP